MEPRPNATIFDDERTATTAEIFPDVGLIQHRMTSSDNSHGAQQQTTFEVRQRDIWKARPTVASELRKVNKPLVERRRRERINRCLDELKNLLANHAASRLEKADILELAVDELRSLRHQQHNGLHIDSPALTYQAGYRDCVHETANFVTQLDDVMPNTKRQLLAALRRHSLDCRQPLGDDVTRIVPVTSRINECGPLRVVIPDHVGCASQRLCAVSGLNETTAFQSCQPGGFHHRCSTQSVTGEIVQRSVGQTRRPFADLQSAAGTSSPTLRIGNNDAVRSSKLVRCTSASRNTEEPLLIAVNSRSPPSNVNCCYAPVSLISDDKVTTTGVDPYDEHDVMHVDDSVMIDCNSSLVWRPW